MKTFSTTELRKPKTLLYAGLGATFGVILFWSLSVGYFTRWQMLDTFSDEKINLVGAVENSAYVVINEDDYFYCSLDLNGCEPINIQEVRWGLIQEPTPAYAENRTTCDTSLPEFFFMLSPTKDPIDCHQVFMHYEDGRGRGSFVVNNSGELWGWFHIESSFDTQFERIYYPLVSAILFVLVGTAWSVLRKRNQ